MPAVDALGHDARDRLVAVEIAQRRREERHPDDEGETDSDWGFEVGAGNGFAFTNKISITPGVTYTSTSHDIEGENESINVSHLRVDVGLRVRL